MPRILLVAFVATLSSAGCAQHRVMPNTFAIASAQAGTTPQQSRPVDRELLRKYVSQLPLGATVKVETTDGKSFKGVLMALESDVVVVQPRRRLPEPARRIPFDIIVSLAPESRDLGVGQALGIGVGAGAASFIALFLIVWSLED
jgi:hypothetical protein